MQTRRGNHPSHRKQHPTVIVIGLVCAAFVGREQSWGAVTLIGEPISLASSHTWNPAACYNGHSDQFLVLWRDTSEPVVGKRLKGQRVDASTGSLVGSYFYMTSDPNVVEAHSGQAAYNPVNGEWFVVFEGTEDPSIEGPDIFGQRIASDGTMVGPHIPLVIKSGFQREPHVACDPVNNRYLLTWFHNTDAISRRIYSRLFDSTGSPLTGEVKLSEVDDREKFDPMVVFNPVYNEYLAAWSDYRAWPGEGQDNQYKDIWGQRVDTGGLKIGANIPIHVPADPVNNPNGQDSLNGLACNTQDGNYAIGFTKLPVGGGDYKTYAMVFDRTASWNSGQIPLSAPDWGFASVPAYNPITNTYLLAYGTTSCMGWEVSPAGVRLGLAQALHRGGVRFPALAVRPSDGRFLLAKAGDNGSYILQLFSLGIDTSPPGAVTAFSATPATMANVLKWTNPASADFTGTLIRYRTDGQYPIDVTDGQLLVDQPGTPGSNSAFVHEVPDSRVTFHYAAFAHDAAPNYAAGVQASASPYAAGDFDFDGDVDQADFGRLQVCFTTTGALVGAGCEDVDLDHDLDVDQGDVSLFQTCAGGAGATPGC